MGLIDIVSGWELLGITGDKSAAVGYVDTKTPLANAQLTLYKTNIVGALRAGLRFKGIELNVSSSHASAASGLTVKESWDDGANWEATPFVYSVSANNPLKQYVKVSAPDIWVQYTNGAVNTSFFRWCILGDRMERSNG